MADWAIRRVEESVVLSYRDPPSGDEWDLCLRLSGEALAEMVAWIMLRQNPAAGDRIVLPCGGVLFACGAGRAGPAPAGGPDDRRGPTNVPTGMGDPKGR